MGVLHESRRQRLVGEREEKGRKEEEGEGTEGKEDKQAVVKDQRQNRTRSKEVLQLERINRRVLRWSAPPKTSSLATSYSERGGKGKETNRNLNFMR
jgi:hypothetical protein